MDGLKTAVIAWIQGIQRAALQRYGVDPIVWFIISTAASPLFYYSIYRVVRAVARKRGEEAMVWSTVFLASTVAPYVYVLIFGRNLPWWVYAAMVLLVGQGVFSLVRRLIAKPKDRAGEEPIEPAREPSKGEPPKQA